MELHPELADALQNERRQELAALEREFDIQVEIIAAPDLHRAEERVDWRDRSKTEEIAVAPAVSAADLADGMDRQTESRHKPKAESAEPPVAASSDDAQGTSESPKPRRRRRGGRRRKKSTGTEAETKSDASEKASPETEEPVSNQSDESVEASGNESKTPAKKSRRRRPRRSKKKTATPAAEEPAPPSNSDPFAY